MNIFLKKKKKKKKRKKGGGGGTLAVAKAMVKYLGIRLQKLCVILLTKN